MRLLTVATEPPACAHFISRAVAQRAPPLASPGVCLPGGTRRGEGRCCLSGTRVFSSTSAGSLWAHASGIPVPLLMPPWPGFREGSLVWCHTHAPCACQMRGQLRCIHAAGAVISNTHNRHPRPRGRPGHGGAQAPRSLEGDPPSGRLGMDMRPWFYPNSHCAGRHHGHFHVHARRVHSFYMYLISAHPPSALEIESSGF